MNNVDKIKSTLITIKSIRVKIPSGAIESVCNYADYIEGLDELSYFVDRQCVDGVVKLCDICDRFILCIMEDLNDDNINDTLGTARELLVKITHLAQDASTVP